MSSSLTVNRLTKGRTASSSAGPLIQNWSGVTVHTSSGLAGCRRTFQNISSIHALLEGLHRNLDGFSILTGGVSSSLVTRINQTCNVGLIKTDHGPLTKGRGDGVLADPSDVTVTVEDTERNVQDVDPLLGLILLKGGVEAGSDVSVDYHSTDTPYVYPSFNDNGFLFNQFEERQSGYTFSHIPLIGPNRNPPQPSKSSYQYRAQEDPYSFVFNDFADSKFNQYEHQLSTGETFQPKSSSVSWESLDHPDSDDWSVEGQSLSSTATIEDELYVHEDTVKDGDLIQGEPFFFEHEKAFGFDYFSFLNTRLRLEEGSDSIFQGVGWGWADEERLHLAGLLREGDFSTVALYEGGSFDDWSSWSGVSAEAKNQNEVVFDFHPDLSVDQSVRLDGSLYEVDTIKEKDSKWHIFLKSDHQLSKKVNIFFDSDIEELASYRLFRNEDGVLTLYGRGGLSPVASLDSLPDLDEVSLPVEVNSVFFGSLSTQKTNKTSWDFVRFSVDPTEGSSQEEEVVVSEDFSELPEQSGDQPWFLAGDHGYTSIVEQDNLHLEQAGRKGVEEGIGWARIEPLLTQHASFYLQTAARVDAFAGNTPLFLNVVDDQKELTLAFWGEDMASASSGETFDVQQNPPSTQVKGSVDPVASDQIDHTFELANDGRETFENAGWSSTLNDNEVTFQNRWMHLDHTDGTSAEAAVTTNEPSTASGENDFEDWAVSTRIRFQEWETDGHDLLPFWVGAEDGDHQVFLRWKDDGSSRSLVFATPSGTVFKEIDYEWDDEFHTYKIIRSEDIYTLFVDGNYQGFVSTSNILQKTRDPFEVFFSVGSKDISLDLDYLFSHSTEYGIRKVGLYRGGDRFDSSSYDFASADWLGKFLPIQLQFDPDDGLEVYLDNQNSASFDLDYQDLPDRSEGFDLQTTRGFVRFGSFEPSGYAESLWKTLFYRIRNGERSDLENISYNTHELATSPDPLEDPTVQSVNIESDDRRTVTLSGRQRQFEDVFQVRHSGSTYSFTWNRQSDVLHLQSDLPGENVDVTVDYRPGQPWSSEYFDELRPLLHLYGETPLHAETEEVTYTSQKVWSSSFNAGAMNNTSYLFNDFSFEVEFEKSGYFQNLQVTEETNEGRDDLLSPAEDQVSEMSLGEFQDRLSLPNQQDHLFNKDTLILDDKRFTLDDSNVVLDGISPTRPEMEDLREESYSVQKDEALDDQPNSFIEDHDGAFILDSPSVQLDDTSSEEGYGELDAYPSSITDIDFDSSFNWP